MVPRGALHLLCPTAKFGWLAVFGWALGSGGYGRRHPQCLQDEANRSPHGWACLLEQELIYYGLFLQLIEGRLLLERGYC